MPIDMPANDEEDAQKESQDFSTPFSPPDGVRDSIDAAHPQTDTNQNLQEHYDAGRDAAAGVTDPANRGILGYDPDKKTTKDEEWPAN